MIGTLECPTFWIFCEFEHSHSSGTLLGYVIGFVFGVHIFLGEITSFILEVCAVEGKDFGKETSLGLEQKFI